MLRLFVIAVSAILLAIGVGCFIAGRAEQGLIALVIWPAVILAAILFERNRYKAPLDAPPGPDWQATGERFADPTTGQSLEVYFQPATGQRAYVKLPATR